MQGCISACCADASGDSASLQGVLRESVKSELPGRSAQDAQKQKTPCHKPDEQQYKTQHGKLDEPQDKSQYCIVQALDKHISIHANWVIPGNCVTDRAHPLPEHW